MSNSGAREALSTTLSDRFEKHWVGQFARIGYLAIGVVYLLMGLLAEMAAWGVGGDLTGAGGATRKLLLQPYGRVLLALIAVGLLVYVAWRLAQSLFDVENRGSDAGGLRRRAGLLLSGLSYLGLAVVALQYLFVGQARLQDPKTEWTAQIMSYPAGRVAAAIAGVAIVCVGLYQFYAAIRAGFIRFIHTHPMNDRAQHVFTVLARLGLASRGVVFSIIGVFVVIGAWQRDPSEAMGLAGVLQLIAQQRYGHALLGLMAAGLMAFGAFMLAKVRYRKIAPTLREDAS